PRAVLHSVVGASQAVREDSRRGRRSHGCHPLDGDVLGGSSLIPPPGCTGIGHRRPGTRSLWNRLGCGFQVAIEASAAVAKVHCSTGGRSACLSTTANTILTTVTSVAISSSA